jgi:ECF transporter S component (folate family)
METKTQKKLFTVQDLAILAILIAFLVVFTRLLSFTSQFLRIGFACIPATIIGVMYPWYWSAIAGVVADLLGMALFPTGGAYFPGFTLSAFIIGVLYSFFYYEKEASWIRVAIATIVIVALDSLILTPLWLNLMYQTPFKALLAIRFVKAPITIVVQTLLTKIILDRMSKIPQVKKRLGIK